MIVRDAAAADAEAIERIARASWTDTYRDIFDAAYIEDFLSRTYAADALASAAERAAERDDGHFLVAERDGELVAFAQFGPGPRGPELFRIYAHPTAYGSGAGVTLLSELHRRIEGRVENYVLDVHPDNERGRAFYDRHGFVVAGVGVTPDCHLMLRRTLSPPRVALPIETDRLRLRHLTERDAERLHDIYGDSETMRYIGASGEPRADLDATRRALAWLRRHDDLHGFGMWAIDERDGEPLVGVAGLLWVEGHGPEVEAAYLLRRDRWGQGYATEALRAALVAGHGIGLERIVALSYPENIASRRVMTKAGMRAAGTSTAYGREMALHVSER